MTVIYRCEVVLPSTTGLPADDVTNVFHVSKATALTGSDPTDLAESIESFYNFEPTDFHNAVAKYINGSISRASGSAEVKIYQVPATPGPLGSPVFVHNWTLADKDAGANEWPNQVACVLSFHSDLTNIAQEGPGNTRPAARRRGRLYIGPLMSSAGNNASPMRVSDQFTGELLTRASELQTALSGRGETWGVFSKSDWAIRPVTSASVDNRLDTQRRRLIKASGRTVHTVP